MVSFLLQIPLACHTFHNIATLNKNKNKNKNSCKILYVKLCQITLPVQKRKNINKCEVHFDDLEDKSKNIENEKLSWGCNVYHIVARN